MAIGSFGTIFMVFTLRYCPYGAYYQLEKTF